MTKALKDAAKALKNSPRFEIRLSAFINQRLKLIETAMNAIFCSQALKVGLNQLSEERQIIFLVYDDCHNTGWATYTKVRSWILKVLDAKGPWPFCAKSNLRPEKYPLIHLVAKNKPIIPDFLKNEELLAYGEGLVTPSGISNSCVT